jgi:acyl-coenzyme A synthetase/AMP-(fatty) acid ligase
MRKTTGLGALLRSAAARTFDVGLMFEQAARRFPGTGVRLDRPLAATGTGRTEYTYEGLADVVDDLAARLRAAGVRPGQHVALHVDGFDITLLGCAAARAGAVPVMLSPALAPAVVGKLLARLNEPWIAVDAGKLAALTAAGTPGARVLLVGDGQAPDGCTADVTALRTLEGAERFRPGPVDPHAPALITHSSGTTGVPKLMVHTARTLFQRLFPQQLIAWPVRRRDPVLLAMSCVHSLGVFLAYGNPMAVVSDTGLETVRRMMVEVRPVVAETHPNNFVLWEDLADDPDRPLSSVKYYSSTFDAIHPGTTKRLLAASGHRKPKLVQLYGQSETGPLSGWITTPRNADTVDGRCIGYALPGFIRIRVVDNDGRPVPRGTIGRLQVRSRARIVTYLGEDARYASQLVGQWWYVTDRGWIDGRRRVYLADREVDQIGDVDSNLALEDALLDRLPELSEVVVVPDAAGRPVPLVATRGDRPLDRTRWERATDGMPELEPVVQWRFEDFPRTSTWKIRRLEIRELLRAGTTPEPVAAGRD